MFGQPVGEVGIGLGVERGHPQDNRLAFDARTHRRQLDGVADDADVKRSVDTLAHHGDDDLGPDRAAHQIDRFIQAQAEHGIAVNMGDVITRLDARGIGRRAVDRRDHFHIALVLSDLDPEAAKLAAGLDPHVCGVIGGQITGMRDRAN